MSDQPFPEGFLSQVEKITNRIAEINLATERKEGVEEKLKRAGKRLEEARLDLYPHQKKVESYQRSLAMFEAEVASDTHSWMQGFLQGNTEEKVPIIPSHKVEDIQFASRDLVRAEIGVEEAEKEVNRRLEAEQEALREFDEAAGAFQKVQHIQKWMSEILHEARQAVEAGDEDDEDPGRFGRALKEALRDFDADDP